jgi:hypothetical protein
MRIPAIKTFALKAAAQTWMKFRVSPGKGTAEVHGTRGAASYINRIMDLDEARRLWRELKAEGWEERPAAEAPRDWWFWN